MLPSEDQRWIALAVLLIVYGSIASRANGQVVLCISSEDETHGTAAAETRRCIDVVSWTDGSKLFNTLDNGETVLHLVNASTGKKWQSEPAKEAFRSMTWSEDDRLLFAVTSNKRLVSLSVENMSFGLPREILALDDAAADRPLSITYSKCSGFLYWTSWPRSGTARIQRARPDATNRTVLIATGLAKPVAISTYGGRLYWIDETPDSFRIESSDLSGENRLLLCEGQASSGIFDLGVTEHWLYWSDWHNMVLWRAPRSISAGACRKEAVLQFNARPMGLAAAIEGAADSCEGQIMTSIEEEKEGEPVTGVSSASTACTADYCLHNLSCSSSPTGVLICECGERFAGPRCERDLCANLCLNGGHCQASEGQAGCLCPRGYKGLRCELLTEGASLPIVSSRHDVLDVFLFCALALSIVVIVALLCHLWRTRQELSTRDSSGLPRVIRKGSSQVKTFYGASSAPEEKKCSADNAQSDVLFDVEDCCQMTICHKPCIEASFSRTRSLRRKCHNLKTTVSPTKSRSAGDDASCSLIQDDAADDVLEKWSSS